MGKPAYRRILLKLSGEALLGDKEFGISADVLQHYATEVKAVAAQGVQVGIVIGGGNIFRGIEASEGGMADRAQADYMGMLATVINGMALQNALEKEGLDTRLMSAITMNQICEPFIRRRAVRHLEKGRIVIFGGGTGNPYFTTDTAAALRASEIGAEVLLKGTKVDGVYDDDPQRNPRARKYQTLSFDEVLARNLRVMDASAVSMCRDNRIPIIVFSIQTPGNLQRLVNGEPVGTTIR